MFSKILHANDGSDHAFAAFQFAMTLAKQNSADLHMVCVEEIPQMPEFIEEVRESLGSAARRFHSVTQRARALAEEQGLNLQVHVLSGHPVRAIIELSRELKADLLIIGANGHSTLYERMIGSRADRIIQLATCPVLVVK